MDATSIDIEYDKRNASFHPLPLADAGMLHAQLGLCQRQTRF
jgi:hypothetical protein